jgi:hypothetical protein
VRRDSDKFPEDRKGGKPVDRLNKMNTRKFYVGEVEEECWYFWHKFWEAGRMVRYECMQGEPKKERD